MTDTMFFQIGLVVITALLGFIGYVIRNFVSSIKEDSKDFRKQFSTNMEEHGKIMGTLDNLNRQLPDIDECKDDLKELKETTNGHGIKITKHEHEIQTLFNKVK